MGNLRDRIVQSLKASRGFAQDNAASILTGLGTGAATYALTGLGKNKGKNRLLRALLAGVTGAGAGYGAHKLQDYMYQRGLRREGDEEDARGQDYGNAYADEQATKRDVENQKAPYENETTEQANKGQAPAKAEDPAATSYADAVESLSASNMDQAAAHANKANALRAHNKANRKSDKALVPGRGPTKKNLLAINATERGTLGQLRYSHDMARKNAYPINSYLDVVENINSLLPEGLRTTDQYAQAKANEANKKVTSLADQIIRQYGKEYTAPVYQNNRKYMRELGY